MPWATNVALDVRELGNPGRPLTDGTREHGSGAQKRVRERQRAWLLRQKITELHGRVSPSLPTRRRRPRRNREAS